MKRVFPAFAIALTLAACATEPPPPPVPTTISDEEAAKLWREAYNAETQPASEAAFTALINRTDITSTQKATFYRGRGIKRGIFVRDDPMAFPQCAVLDFREFDRLAAADDPRRKDLDYDLNYQFSRFKYFKDAPEACKTPAATYKAEWYASQ